MACVQPDDTSRSERPKPQLLEVDAPATERSDSFGDAFSNSSPSMKPSSRESDEKPRRGSFSGTPTAAFILGHRHFASFDSDEEDNNDGRNHIEIDEELEEYNRIISGDLSQRQPELEWEEEDETEVQYRHRAKHLLLTLRLRKAYALYCLVCFILSLVVCSSAVFKVVKLKKQGKIVEHKWETWEVVLQAIIGIAICCETGSTLWLRGWKSFSRDCWCVLDALVATLTVLDWILSFMERFVGDVGKIMMADVDLPLFALRFLLQPFRLLASLTMVRRVTRMQKNTGDITWDVLEEADIDVEASDTSRILTPELRSEVISHLPVWCRFRSWDLLYCLRVNGTSLQTFYRQQSGPNLIIVLDTKGNVFGGFVEEAWHIGNYRGKGESFVFSARPREESTESGPKIGNSSSMEFYHSNEVLLWADNEMFAISTALVVNGDFKYGTSTACPVLGSPPLADDGTEFDIADFECWSLREDSSPRVSKRGKARITARKYSGL